MATGSGFTSVKLAAALVDDARAAALTMRRSVTTQIEYWATLGRALESAGLAARDTGALIAPRHQSLEFVNADIHERDDLSHIGQSAQALRSRCGVAFRALAALGGEHARGFRNMNRD